LFYDCFSSCLGAIGKHRQAEKPRESGVFYGLFSGIKNHTAIVATARTINSGISAHLNAIFNIKISYQYINKKPPEGGFR